MIEIIEVRIDYSEAIIVENQRNGIDSKIILWVPWIFNYDVKVKKNNVLKAILMEDLDTIIFINLIVLNLLWGINPLLKKSIGIWNSMKIELKKVISFENVLFDVTLKINLFRIIDS